MAGKNDPVKVEDFALLELGRAPDGRERWQLDPVGSIRRAHANHQRAVLLRNRKKVVDHFKTAGLDVLARFFNGFFDGLLDFPFGTVDGFGHLTRYFHFLRYLFVGPVDAGDIGEKIEGQLGVVTQERRHGDGAFGRKAQGVLQRRCWDWTQTRRPRREPPPQSPP